MSLSPLVRRFSFQLAPRQTNTSVFRVREVNHPGVMAPQLIATNIVNARFKYRSTLTDCSLNNPAVERGPESTSYSEYG